MGICEFYSRFSSLSRACHLFVPWSGVQDFGAFLDPRIACAADLCQPRQPPAHSRSREWVRGASSHGPPEPLELPHRRRRAVFGPRRGGGSQVCPALNPPASQCNGRETALGGRAQKGQQAQTPRITPTRASRLRLPWPLGKEGRFKGGRIGFSTRAGHDVTALLHSVTCK